MAVAEEMGVLESPMLLIKTIVDLLVSQYFPSKERYRERHGGDSDDPPGAAPPPAPPESANPFDVLGVDKDADLATVRKAFHNLARQWHPDKNIGDEEAAKEKMQELNEAYSACLEALGDGASDDEDEEDEEDEQPRASAQEQRDAEEQQWGEQEREFRRWRKEQKRQEKNLRREQQKTVKRQHRESKWDEQLKAVLTMKKQQLVQGLTNLGVTQESRNDDVESLRMQLIGAIQAKRDEER